MASNELVPKGAAFDPVTQMPLQVRVHDKSGGTSVMTVCRALVPLSVKKGGGLTTIQGNTEINSEGYRQCNRIASLHILDPLTVTCDGHVVDNPVYERNLKSRLIERVIISKAVAGPSPLGKWVVVKKTLHFDVSTYLNQSLMKTISKSASCGCMGNRNFPPEQFDIYDHTEGSEGEKVRARSIEAPPAAQLEFFPIHGDDFGIWLDTRHPDVVAMWKDFSGMLQFISRRAETTVLRLCLQEHPAIGAKQVQVGEGGIAHVPVFFHEAGLTPDQVKQLEASLGSGPATPEAPVDVVVIDEAVDGERAGEEIAGETDDAASEAIEAGAREERGLAGDDEEGRGYGD